MNRGYDYLRRVGIVMPVDLSGLGRDHPMRPSHPVDLGETVTALWVVWGETHVREALANASCFWSLHSPWFRQLRVEVRILGDALVPEQTIEACRRRGMFVTTGLGDPPTNRALFDMDRLRHAVDVGGSVLYFDSDLYAVRPISISPLLDKRFATFGMGGALIDRYCFKVHQLVDECVEAPSYIYWKDVGLEPKDYDSGAVWPWLRINLGMFWIRDTKGVREFLREFERHNETMAFTNYFGLGEMIFTAMCSKGIDGHEFCWRNGWNKIWPWIQNHDQQIGLSVKDGVVNGLYPTGRHDVIHMSHLGMCLHGGGSPMRRRFHMWADDSGDIHLYVGSTPRGGPTGRFETL
jgi:hypothetical protein